MCSRCHAGGLLIVCAPFFLHYSPAAKQIFTGVRNCLRSNRLNLDELRRSDSFIVVTGISFFFFLLFFMLCICLVFVLQVSVKCPGSADDWMHMEGLPYCPPTADVRQGRIGHGGFHHAQSVVPIGIKPLPESGEITVDRMSVQPTVFEY